MLGGLSIYTTLGLKSWVGGELVTRCFTTLGGVREGFAIGRVDGMSNVSLPFFTHGNVFL